MPLVAHRLFSMPHTPTAQRTTNHEQLTALHLFAGRVVGLRLYLGALADGLGGSHESTRCGLSSFSNHLATITANNLLFGAETFMATCSKCGATVAEQKAFCQDCGAPTAAQAAERPAATPPSFGATVIMPPSQWPSKPPAGGAASPPQQPATPPPAQPVAPAPAPRPAQTTPAPPPAAVAPPQGRNTTAFLLGGVVVLLLIVIVVLFLLRQ